MKRYFYFYVRSWSGIFEARVTYTCFDDNIKILPIYDLRFLFRE